MAEDTTLGRELIHALEAVNRLIPQVASDAEFEAVRRMRTRLIGQLDELVSVNLVTARWEYRTATSRMQRASAGVRQAVDGLEDVAQAMETLGHALDRVAGLMSM
jgi:hypothetical protein